MSTVLDALQTSALSAAGHALVFTATLVVVLIVLTATTEPGE
jgi:hypothetical protein